MVVIEAPQAEMPGVGVMGMGTPNELTRVLLGGCVYTVEIRRGF